MTPEARQKILALEDLASFPYRSLVCWLLDPAQTPSPHGEYNPRRVTRDLATHLASHKLAREFITIEDDPLNSKLAFLWLKENYDTNYAHWRAKKDLSDGDRASRLVENTRMASAIQNYIAYERKHNRRTRAEVLEEMVLVMISNYKELGEASPFVRVLKQIKYIEEEKI